MTAAALERQTSAASGLTDLTRITGAVLAVFLIVRPSLDNLATFDVGPNLNLPIGGLFVIAMAGFLVHSMATRPAFVLPTSSLAALVLAAAAVLSALGADSLGSSGSMAIRVVSVALVFVAANELAFRRQEFAVPIAAAAGLGLALTAPIAIGQLGGWIPRPAGDSLSDTRVPGPFPAPTVFATCMLVVIALIVGLAPIWWRRHPNLIWFLGPVAAGAAYLMLVNGSRSPLAALLVGIVLIAAGQRRWLLIVPFGVIGGLLVLANPSLLERPLEVFDQSEETVVPGAETDTFAWRVRIWEESLVLVEESPIVGIGIGGVEERNGNVPPHSTTVQALVEMGYVGVVAHYLLVVTVAAALVRGVVRSSDRTTICLLSISLGLCVGYFAMSFVENLLTQVVTSAPVATITGLALGLDRSEAARRS